jgi:hypothetical protein
MIVDPYRFAAAVGGPVPTFFANGANGSNSANAVTFWPAGTAVNDIGIVMIATANQAPPATPAGCTPIYTPTGTGTAGVASSIAFYVYWIRATSASMPGISSGDSGTDNVINISVFRGCVATGSPIDAFGTDTAASSTSVSIPGLTTLGSNRLVVAGLGWGSTNSVSGFANGDLTSFAEIQDVGTTRGGFALGAGTKATAGAVVVTTATLATADVQERLSFALIPA